MARRALAFALLAALLPACSPIAGLDATVNVPPDVQQAVSADLPQQVLLSIHEINVSPANAETIATPIIRIGILCQASTSAVAFHGAVQWSGSPDVNPVLAYLAPLGSPSDRCGSVTPVEFVQVGLPAGAPTGSTEVRPGDYQSGPGFDHPTALVNITLSQ